MLTKSDTIPNGWLAFELNVLRRLKFGSIVLPFTPEPHLGAYLKRWNIRVAANDPTQSAWIKAVGLIQNNGEKLSGDDLNLILEDAYIPRYRLQNETLKNWFTETDAWWFDNVRQSIEQLASPVARAIALSAGMGVGDYVLSFDEETRRLRQPLSKIYKQLLSIQPEIFNNGQNNLCQNKSANEFVAENSTDAMFLRLPPAHNQKQKNNLGSAAWREEWLRYGDEFWNDLETAQTGKLGTFTETKSQYLRFVEEFFRTASHIPTWAIEHIENGFVSTQDIVETIGRIRRVDTIFTKDFSELTGTKAVIITA
ncbi:MAG: hypothetical protein M3521_01015 [Acidobacteriota bacterium]|jgi:hypothetical protein|nr:hypothetical protein [Acidobacteriota bacterium]MDQ3372455.1 hypothetical protein [Acidobacteriota bacterium]